MSSQEDKILFLDQCSDRLCKDEGLRALLVYYFCALIQEHKLSSSNPSVSIKSIHDKGESKGCSVQLVLPSKYIAQTLANCAIPLVRPCLEFCLDKGFTVKELSASGKGAWWYSDNRDFKSLLNEKKKPCFNKTTYGSCVDRRCSFAHEGPRYDVTVLLAAIHRRLHDVFTEGVPDPREGQPCLYYMLTGECQNHDCKFGHWTGLRDEFLLVKWGVNQDFEEAASLEHVFFPNRSSRSAGGASTLPPRFAAAKAKKAAPASQARNAFSALDDGARSDQWEERPQLQPVAPPPPPAPRDEQLQQSGESRKQKKKKKQEEEAAAAQYHPDSWGGNYNPDSWGNNYNPDSWGPSETSAVEPEPEPEIESPVEPPAPPQAIERPPSPRDTTYRPGGASVSPALTDDQSSSWGSSSPAAVPTDTTPPVTAPTAPIGGGVSQTLSPDQTASMLQALVLGTPLQQAMPSLPPSTMSQPQQAQLYQQMAAAAGYPGMNLVSGYAFPITDPQTALLLQQQRAAAAAQFGMGHQQLAAPPTAQPMPMFQSVFGQSHQAQLERTLFKGMTTTAAAPLQPQPVSPPVTPPTPTPTAAVPQVLPQAASAAQERRIRVQKPGGQSVRVVTLAPGASFEALKANVCSKLALDPSRISEIAKLKSGNREISPPEEIYDDETTSEIQDGDILGVVLR